MKSQIDLFNEKLSLEAVALFKKTKDIVDNVDYDKLFFTGGNKNPQALKNFKTLEKDIHSENLTIDKGEIKQNEFTEVLDKLKVYPARGYKCIDLKESVSKNTKNFYDGWKKICYGFKMEYYHFLKRLV